MYFVWEEFGAKLNIATSSFSQFSSDEAWHIIKWAASWQNQQRLKSAWAPADAQADLSLHWAHSLCWFCQVAAQIDWYFVKSSMKHTGFATNTTRSYSLKTTAVELPPGDTMQNRTEHNRNFIQLKLRPRTGGVSAHNTNRQIATKIHLQEIHNKNCLQELRIKPSGCELAHNHFDKFWKLL